MGKGIPGELVTTRCPFANLVSKDRADDLSCVNALSWSRDGGTLLSGSDDRR